MPDLNRRDFLNLLGAGATGGGLGFWFGESLKHPIEQLIPALIPPEDLIPGLATWYSSACGLCPAGCGILVRNREGRAKKLEGNPGHPVNQGGLCALGQAGLNQLYHPDRLRAPQKRVGPRGSGQFQDASWDGALAALGQGLAAIRTQGRAEWLTLIAKPQTGHLDALIHRFMKTLGSERYWQHEAIGSTVAANAHRQALGLQHAPRDDLGRSRLVLSFGADFLGSGETPVHAARAYGQMRRGRPGERGRLVQIEPRLSLTGASADLWLPVKPGTEGLVALGLARALVEDGHYAGADRDDWAAALAPYTPDFVASTSELPLERLRALAHDAATLRPALALAGGATGQYSNGLANVLAIQALNYLMGSLDAEGGVRGNPPPLLPARERPLDLARWQTLIDDAQAGRLAGLIFLDCNPVHELPQALGLRQALAQVPLVLSLSTFPDETNTYADWRLPLPSYLESWNDSAPRPGVGLRSAALSQPVVAPLYGARTAGDILLDLARRVGSPLPWPDFLSYLKDGWSQLHAQRADAGAPADFAAFWDLALTAGIWGDGQAGTEIPRWQPAALPALAYQPARYAGTASDYPLLFQPYASPNLHAGEAAALPWLQELPDPLTGIVYAAWLEINPRTAASLGLALGDIVWVESSVGRVEVPVLPYPAIHPELVAMPLARGHTQLGRYAAGKGANAVALVAPERVEGTDALAWAATRVRIVKTGRRVEFPRQGEHEHSLGRSLFGDIPIRMEKED